MNRTMGKLAVLVMVLSLVIMGNVYAVDQTADHIKQVTGSGLAIGNPSGILGISLKGTTAGDTIGVYDDSDTHRSGPDVGNYDIRDLEFELSISANNGFVHLPCYGAPFARGVRILSTASTTVTSITFDY